MDQTQHSITGIDTVDDDPDVIDIVDFLQRQMFVPHLLVNSPEMLVTPQYPRLDAIFQQTVTDTHLQLTNDFPAMAAHPLHRSIEHAIPQRIEMAEAQVFQLQP